MSKEKLKKPGVGRAPQEYGIAMHAGDGSLSYYYFDERHRDAGGRPLERWGRLSQAARFASEAEAHRAVDGIPTSYQVVQLVPKPQ